MDEDKKTIPIKTAALEVMNERKVLRLSAIIGMTSLIFTVFLTFISVYIGFIIACVGMFYYGMLLRKCNDKIRYIDSKYFKEQQKDIGIL